MSGQITTALSLYDIEVYHQAMIDSADLVESPEEQEQFELEMQQAVAASVEKRDQVATGRELGRKYSTVPVLTLDNGRRISFLVDETEVGEYGIRIWISDKTGAAKGEDE